MSITTYAGNSAPITEQRTTNPLDAFLRSLISVLDGTNIDLSYDSATGVISASITGTLARGNLPSAIAYEDEANTFTLAQQINSTLGVTGTVTIGQIIALTAAAGAGKELRFQSAGSNRWIFQCNTTAESGSNVGSDLNILARSDAGASIGTALMIYRATMQAIFGGEVIHPANTTLGANAGSYGGGAKVVFVGNAGTNPSTNPTGGGVLYCDGGALKFRGSGGTVTTVAVA